MAVRRNTRLRREYLYRKSLEGKEREFYERRRRIREALQEGKTLPTELTAEADALRDELALDDDGHDEQKTHMDDEYARAGEIDPKVLVTTARDPSSRLKQFAKEIKLVFPNAERINRGGTIIKDVVDLCRRNDFSDIIILHETRGEPDGMIVSHLPFGPTAYFSLNNTVLRHDIAREKGGIGNMSEAHPHLIFNNFSTKLGIRVTNILKHLFPAPKDESKRVIAFANDDDYISFRHHTYTKVNHKEVTLQEVGPRFEMKLYQLKLGTVDITSADNEWIWRPYQNTAKSRQVL
jgi:U3 small nucleolar ribonucleoprotein protein IMP4